MVNIGSKIHLGKIIQEKVNKSGLTITEFAEKINLSRPAVYQMFNKQSVDSDLLVRISLILKENICEFICREAESALTQHKAPKKNVIEEKEVDDKSETDHSHLHLIKKLETIHQDLLSIKNILQEMKTLQEVR